jgi:23S rRNA pseudouridine2457 synthase
LKPRPNKLHYILFNKPYGVLSQFTPACRNSALRRAGTPEHNHSTLKDFGSFPSDVYPVGRLDADSEGLLLLTNDNAVKHRMTDPKFEHERTYLVQVERIPSNEALQKLCNGIVIEGKKTKPAEVKLLDAEPNIPPRPVPIRFRKTVPTAWIELTLREGRNHQVRKMTAAVGHPTLRLVRIKTGTISLEGLAPSKWRDLREDELELLKRLLNIR